MRWGRGIWTLLGIFGATFTGLLGVAWLTVLLAISTLIVIFMWLVSLDWKPKDIESAAQALSSYKKNEATLLHEHQRQLEQWRHQNTAVIYHRRYVVPRVDFDMAHARQWNRAIVAANRIYASEVVGQNLIDSAQITAVMPYRLWEIAERPRCRHNGGPPAPCYGARCI